MSRYIIFFLSVYGSIDTAFSDSSINIDKLTFNSSWNTLDFLYPTENARQHAINDGSFVPGAAVPIDVDLHYHRQTGARIFMTTPRIADGVPTTVGYISKELSADGSSLIKPYPNLEMNTLNGNCDRIISVYRVKVDECNRLWVLDTGIYLNVPICPPKLLLFNLLNDKLISSYVFDTESILNSTLFITPVVDIRNNQCDDAFVYIADVERYQLFVYDHKNKKSWGIRNRHFYPNPDHGTYTINNLSFDLMDGLFGMALGPLMSNGNRVLYFHALASVKEQFVYTSLIRNSTKFEANPGAELDSFGEYPYERPSQSAAEAMNKDGILFYGSLSENSVKCWNSADEFNGTHVDTVLRDSEFIQFTAGLKVTNSAMGPEMVLINSIAYQKLANGVLTPNEINFHIIGVLVERLISGTKCVHHYDQNHHQYLGRPNYWL